MKWLPFDLDYIRCPTTLKFSISEIHWPSSPVAGTNLLNFTENSKSMHLISPKYLRKHSTILNKLSWYELQSQLYSQMKNYPSSQRISVKHFLCALCVYIPSMFLTWYLLRNIGLVYGMQHLQPWTSSTSFKKDNWTQW